MIIRHILHDCFTVRQPGCGMVFDYWQERGGSDNREELPGWLDDMDASKPLYVFVSHSHKDHFNRRIFEFADRFPHVRYLLSRETMRRCRHITSPSSVYNGPKVDADKVIGFSDGDSWSDGNISVHAFGSTDTGVSFMAETDGRLIYHAGDNNAWLWLDESTAQEVAQARRAFTAILDDIGAWLEGRRIDVAFFPVDSRIGRRYYEGAREFVHRFDVGTFIPMHCGLGDPSEQRLRQHDATQFNLYANGDRGQYIALFGDTDAIQL